MTESSLCQPRKEFLQARATLPVLLATLWTTLSGCMLFGPQRQGAVRFYGDIPSSCDTVRGLRQQVIKQVHSEEEMRKHYGLTFRVYFQDNESPESLYGVLYYQDPEANKYCMALPDGRFAVFSDRQFAENRRNVSHEVCFPIKDCSVDDGRR